MSNKIIDFLCIFKDLKSIFMPRSARTVPNIVRLAIGVNLKKHGILFKMKNISKGLYSKPFSIEFGTLLKDFSNSKVDIEAVNTYTLGNFKKLKPVNKRLKFVSNLLDPESKFKDSWFGCYIIFDDEEGKGRKYLLKDPDGNPDSYDNIKSESMLYLTELDQKLVTWSSHDGQKGYTRDIHDNTFFFNQTGEINTGTVKDKENREWFKVDGSFKTYSLLPDIDKTDMSLFESNRCYSGLPNRHVYKYVSPWHNITFHGSNIYRYFRGSEVCFWANVYYGGVEYQYKDGTKINNWKNTDISRLFYDMFLSLEIKPVKQHKNIKKYAKKKQDQIWLKNKE
jgi:hypothetical protein